MTEIAKDAGQPGRGLLGINERVIITIHHGVATPPTRHTGTIVEREDDRTTPYVVLDQDGGRVTGRILIFLGPGITIVPAPPIHPVYAETADPPPHPGLD